MKIDQVAETPRADIIIFSSWSSSFPVNLWIIRLTLASLVESFRIREGVRLFAFVHCPSDSSGNMTMFWHYLKTYRSFNNVASLHLECMKSLPQGFCQALHRSTAEFFFFVEHDWYFIKRNIHHSLKDILNVMQRYESISIMRFTARRVLKYPEQTGSSFCLQSTESLDFIDASPSALYSNNPYLIKRELAHDLMGAFCSGPLDTVLPGKFESYSQHYCSGGFFKGSQKNETISECASIKS
jgi:hypothetical protein